MTVAYCANAAMAGPARVSAYTMLMHLRGSEAVNVYVLQEGWTLQDKLKLESALQRSGRNYTLSIHSLDLTPFAGLPSLHGDRTNYARLLLPEKIKAERVLYVDADTLPLLDLKEVYESDLEGCTMGAVAWNTTVGKANDRKALFMEGLVTDLPYFNSGVLVIDVHKFNTDEVYNRCMSAALRLGDDLINHEQTMLNVVLRGQIKALPWRYNVRLGPNAKAFTGGGIAHFVGALKPWDPLGRWLHDNSELWECWAEKAHEAPYRPLERYARFRRTSRLLPTYIKVVTAKLKLE